MRIALAAALALAAQTALAAGLPEGSFKGNTEFVKSPDCMALLIRKDPMNAEAYYAVLAEYDRIIGAVGSDRVAITKWVPRMYAYRIEKVRDTRWMMRPLQVSAAGEIEPAPGVADYLTLKKAGSLKGAVLERFDKGSVIVTEKIKFSEKLGSTWEPYVAGKYFGTKDSSGGTYFDKTVNMTLSADKVADFAQDQIQGKFDAAEKAPGMWVFAPKGAVAKGADQILGRIGVFIDIVNWKPIFTTDELLLINPADPKDVGFYYERH